MTKKQNIIVNVQKITFTCILCLCFAVPVAHGVEPAYELGFSPEGESLQIVLNGISNAKESIVVAAYSFRNSRIAEALLEAHKRNVKVAIVIDSEKNPAQCAKKERHNIRSKLKDNIQKKSKKYSIAIFLANNKIPVRLNGCYGKLHHKFMVIDGNSVQLGSFNYSTAAVNQNAENVLLLKDVPSIATKYMIEWKKLWDEGVDVQAKY